MNKIEKMLHELSLHFTNYMQGEDQAAAWARSWSIAFKNTEPWVLEAATQRMIETRDERKHPLIADMRKIVREVLELESANSPKMAVQHEQQHSDTFALADTLINCEMGREAARAEPCWLLALHDFCRVNRRLPTGHEINRCKQVAAEFQDRYSECVRGLAGPDSKGLAAFAETMIRRSEALRARLLGREAA
jgi:hypothetical protein